MSQINNIKEPKFFHDFQWRGYKNEPWFKKDKKDVTVMFSFVERRKSNFLGAYLTRRGFKNYDMGDHVLEDVRWGKEYGNRMECNPMYFTSGSLIRNLMKIHNETGMSKAEIAKKYIFLGGGGQCGPCRYGMYPQEYMKSVNDAGFKDFRMIIFSSDTFQAPLPKGSALQLNLHFRINMLISIVLADILHIAECALRPYAKDKKAALKVIDEAENILMKAFLSKLYLIKLPMALRKVGRMFAAIERKNVVLPQIYVTGEFFANLAHNEGNYNLRRFIMDDDCEVLPGSFVQRIKYDNWRRSKEAERGAEYAGTRKERKMWRKSLRKQRVSTKIIDLFYNRYILAVKPWKFGGRHKVLDLDEMADLAFDHYHPEIFGGEGNLEIAEAIYYADKVDGFISSKPFGCMPSSGVSDGVQSKIMAMNPGLNFLSIETSGDNEVSILSRVSMLLFKAKQKRKERKNSN